MTEKPVVEDQRSQRTARPECPTPIYWHIYSKSGICSSLLGQMLLLLLEAGQGSYSLVVRCQWWNLAPFPFHFPASHFLTRLGVLRKGPRFTIINQHLVNTPHYEESYGASGYKKVKIAALGRLTNLEKEDRKMHQKINHNLRYQMDV